MAKTGKPTSEIRPKDKLLPKFTIFFFDRVGVSLVLWLAIFVFGIVSYTTLLKREGFPAINIPLTIVSGTYFANDATKVDNQVAKPVTDVILKLPNVEAVGTNSSANFFVINVQYAEGTDAKAATDSLKEAVASAGVLPSGANLAYNVPYFGATGGDSQQIDEAISFYAVDGEPATAELVDRAQALADRLKADSALEGVKDVFVKNPLQTAVDQSNGKTVSVERNFDRFGVREDGTTRFRDSVIIGIAKSGDTDVIKLDAQTREALDRALALEEFDGYGATISASFATSIKENISELQKVLLEGLLAVLIVGSLVIAIRASVITVISMVTVLVSSIAFMYLFGYSLNVITLFALILSLALIVDDTIIMVEAIDAARRKSTDRRRIVKEATVKVSRAMVAATLTASLSFAPLLFVGGVLGDFIAAIPVTIIASLLISLVVALVFIPFFSRFILLGTKQLGKKSPVEFAAGIEAKVAAFVARPMLWARHSQRRLLGVGLIAVAIGLAFIGGAGVVGKNVVFNIFPPTKDSNTIAVDLKFPAGTTIETAKKVAADADALVGETLQDNFEQASYYTSGSADSGTLQIELISYQKRSVTSVQLVENLQQRFDADFKEAQATAYQIDVGPPAAAFTVQIAADSRSAAYRLANDVASYLRSTELSRLNGTTARLTNISVTTESQVVLRDGKPVVIVSGGFDADDTTTLVTLAKDAVEKEFSTQRVASYGLASDALMFDLGQEQDNQDSFKALVLAFPVLLFVMYLLLAVQFRSFLQPLLIFLAIPFSLFGIMLGLDLTNNAISFFTMLGFFALLGLSIKNTILVTDFANQAKRAGMSTIDATVAALEERFRPLFATSMTAVVSLIPLALSSPFWQGLAVVLIFGLLSSTVLVITVFPYYYLGGEWLRRHIHPRSVAMFGVGAAFVAWAGASAQGAALAAILVLFYAVIVAVIRRRMSGSKS